MKKFIFILRENIPLFFLLSICTVLSVLSFVAHEVMFGFLQMGVGVVIACYAFMRGDFNSEHVRLLKQSRRTISLNDIESLIVEGQVQNLYAGGVQGAQEQAGEVFVSLAPGFIQAFQEVIMVRLTDGTYRYAEVSNGLTLRVEGVLKLASEHAIPVENHLNPSKVGHPIRLGIIIVCGIVVFEVILQILDRFL